MELYVLGSQYEILGMIDEADSVLWNPKYNDVGECEVYTACDAANVELLKLGNYLYRFDDEMFCKIVARSINGDEEQGDYLTATGNDIAHILGGRIVRWKITYSGTVARFIEKVLIDNVKTPAQSQRAIPNFRIDTSNFSELNDVIEVSAFTDDLLQLIVATCKTCNYGFRLSYDITARELVFRLYKGKYRASPTIAGAIEFSPRNANIISTDYKEDESGYKNLAYVGYKLSDGNEQTLLSVFNSSKEPTGEDRREIYVDGTGVSRNITDEEIRQMFPDVELLETKPATEDENIDAVLTYRIRKDGKYVVVADGVRERRYVEELGFWATEEKITTSEYTHLLLIKTLGLNALAENTQNQEFSGNVDTIVGYEYKKDYNLGDIVIVTNDYGISAEARITEVMESDDNDDGYVVEPRFEYQAPSGEIDV